MFGCCVWGLCEGAVFGGCVWGCAGGGLCLGSVCGGCVFGSCVEWAVQGGCVGSVLGALCLGAVCGGSVPPGPCRCRGSAGGGAPAVGSSARPPRPLRARCGRSAPARPRRPPAAGGRCPAAGPLPPASPVPPPCRGRKRAGGAMAAEGDVELELETEPNGSGGGGSDGAGGRAAEKPRKHDSGAADLERVTDYAEEKEIQSSNLETVRPGRERRESRGGRGGPGSLCRGLGAGRVPVPRPAVTALIPPGHVGDRRPAVPGAEGEAGEVTERPRARQRPGTRSRPAAERARPKGEAPPQRCCLVAGRRSWRR